MKSLNRHGKDHFDLISIWYPKLKDFTFETSFLNITSQEAHSILNYRGHCRNIATLLRFAENDEQIQDVKKMEPMEMLKDEEKKCLSELNDRLDNAIKVFGSAFVRLNSRSPKDAVLSGEKVKTVIRQEIKRLSDYYGNKIGFFDVASIAYWRSISMAQKVESGEEAMKLLLHSNRVSEDISKGELAQGEEFSTKIVLRKWVSLEPESEFRVFVVGGTINAITQYHKKCFVPEFLENKEKIERLIFDKFNELKGFVSAPDDTYTIDFAITKKFHEAVMVEINDPPPTAGTSLFLWENDSDKNILLNGPYEFRILTAPVPWEEQDDIHPPLKTFIDEINVSNSSSCNMM